MKVRTPRSSPKTVDHCFNPRTREGANVNESTNAETIQCFNPRTREGANRQTVQHSNDAAGFNPRTREGANFGDIQWDMGTDVSIHAPVKVRTNVISDHDSNH